MTLSRRNFVKQGLALTFTVAGQPLLLTPREAHAAKAPFSILTAQEAETLKAVCEGLPPAPEKGARPTLSTSNLALTPITACCS